MEQEHVEGGECVFFLEGRISQENIQLLEQELQLLLDAHPGYPLVLDALNLDYISSRGLRALLKTIRESTGELSIRNASEKVYSVLATAGVTDLVYVEESFKSPSSGSMTTNSQLRHRFKPVRSISTNGSQIVGKGRSSIVYLLDSETLVKKYNKFVPLEKIYQEIERARTAFVYGIPTAMPLELVSVDDSYGMIFERIAPAETVGRTISANSARNPLLQRWHSHRKEGRNGGTLNECASLSQSVNPYIGKLPQGIDKLD